MECYDVVYDGRVVEDCVLICVAYAVDDSDFAGITWDGHEERLEDVGKVS